VFGGWEILPILCEYDKINKDRHEAGEDMPGYGMME